MTGVDQLRVLIEARVGKLRIRQARCNGSCNGECNHGVIAIGHDEKPLWIVVVADELDEINDQFSGVMAGLEDPDWAETAEYGIVLHGMTWPKLNPATAVRQALQFGADPDWMLDVPLEQLWRLRGVVFGDDITRVPIAIANCRAYARHRQ
jgi:hypothetical protein